MIYRTLGRTGLEVSACGVGSGDPSRLGTKNGVSRTQAERVIREAIDLGVNLVDTAPIYGTEDIVGSALSSVPRDSYFLSSKSPYMMAVRNGWDKIGDRAVRALESSLRLLRTDHLDLYIFHSITHGTYDRVVSEIYPIIQREVERGKVRFVGISDHRDDKNHATMGAVDAKMFDVVLLNCRARLGSLVDGSDRIFRGFRSAGVGTIAVSVNDRARPTPKSYADVLKKADCVLIGTGSVDHLRDNIRAVESAYPSSDRESNAL